MVQSGAIPRHDLIVIGASAGGVEALTRLLSRLPVMLPAAICLVQHIMATSRLVEVLQRGTGLPVQWGEHGDWPRTGEVFVAPAGVHMLLDADGKIALAGGPPENRSRPAINRLFRSAAAHYGSRTIGVLLTGMLDDGVAGLVVIKEVGGLVVVQDPDDAAFPDMPRSALARVPVDRVLPIDAIGAALVLMCQQPAPDIEIPAALILAARRDAEGLAGPAVVRPR